MNQRVPSLDLLKGFEAVARHLSFTKAAAELFVTQSAVSRQVRQLEEQLGVRLFERRTRGVVLTDAGYRYYSELAPLLRQIGELTQKVAAERPVQRVRVTTTLTFSSLWLVPRLAAFQEKHPGVDVHVVADNAVRDLVRDDFDVAVRYSSKGEAGPDAVQLFDERLTPVCSPKWLKTHRLTSCEELNDHVLIHFHDLEGRAPWLSWDNFLGAVGCPEVRGKGAAYFSHYDQAIRAARSAQGVALGRIPVIDALIAEGELVAPIESVSAFLLPDRAYWLITRESRPEVTLFTAWLREEAESSSSPRSRAPARTTPARSSPSKAGR